MYLLCTLGKLQNSVFNICVSACIHTRVHMYAHTRTHTHYTVAHWHSRYIQHLCFFIVYIWVQSMFAHKHLTSQSKFNFEKSGHQTNELNKYNQYWLENNKYMLNACCSIKFSASICTFRNFFNVDHLKLWCRQKNLAG